MTGVTIDPESHTISAVRSLRTAGASLTLTIPPAVLDTIGAGEGDDIELVAHMDTGEIVCRRVEDDDPENGEPNGEAEA